MLLFLFIVGACAQERRQRVARCQRSNQRTQHHADVSHQRQATHGGRHRGHAGACRCSLLASCLVFYCRSGFQSDLDEAINARRAAEDRADRLAAENARLNDELRNEQENYRNAETLRKQLEVEIREITVRLEEAEQFAQREGKRMVAKLQARLRDLESELDLEQRRSRELAAHNRKVERQLNEIRVQAEDDHRVRQELTDQVSTLTMRIKTLRRQLEEAVSTLHSRMFTLHVT